MKWAYNKKRVRTSKLPIKRLAVLVIVLIAVPFLVFRPVSAAIAFRAAATANNAGGGTTLSIAMPTGTVARDVMIAVVSIRGGTGVTTTPPSGWTQISTTTSSNVLRSSVFYKVASSTESGPYVFTFSVGDKASGVISSYSGVDSLQPINKASVQANASSATMTAPSVTTTHDNAWIIAGFSTATGTTVTPGSSMTERGEDASTGAGAGSRTTTQLQDINQATAGASGSKTATAGAAAVNIGHIVALTPKLNMKMSAYRWFDNANSTTPGSALAAQNTAASVGAGAVRLQMLTHIEEGKTSPYYGVKLKYAARGVDNVCDANGTNETYFDIVDRTKTKNAFPATGVDTGTGGSTSWNLPAYAAGGLDDFTSYISLNMSNPTSNYLKLTDLGFNIPSTATINGIKITTNSWADTYDPGNDEIYMRAYAVKGGTVQTTPSATQTMDSTSTSNFITFPSSMYGTTLTPADVNASTFGVALQTDMSFSPLGNNANVSSVSVQVIYSDGGVVKFQDNASPVDGATAVNGGLTHSTDPITLGSYNESNISATQPNGAFQSSGDLLHDFSLNLGSLGAGTYCFMAYRDDDTALGTTHDVVPQITITPPSITQANYRWFANADSAVPGAALATQDTSASVAAQVPFRLRQRLAVDTAQLSQSGQSFELQYAEKSGTCDTSFSGEAYASVRDSSAFGTKLGTSAVEDTSSGFVSWGSGVATLNVTDGGYSGVGSSGSTVTSYIAKLTGYGFSVPTGATITGFSVAIPYGVSVLSPTYVPSLSVTPIVGGTITGTYPTQYFGTSEASTITLGGPTSLFGLTSPTPAQVNASNFGFALQLAAEWDPFSLDDSSISIDSATVKVFYTIPNRMNFHNNATPADATSISSTANDPTNAGRSAVYQTYRETDPFTNSVLTIPSGQDGIWDFPITTNATAAGKTFCFRVVKADGSLLNTYSQIPEITITSTGPTLDQVTRGGGGVINGVKQNFTW